MELTDALRTTGAVREFTDEPVDDATLARVLDTARFAPSGGAEQRASAPAVGFAERLDEVPVLLALFTDLSALAASTAMGRATRSRAELPSTRSRGAYCWQPAPSGWVAS
jgi:nitroreductase